MAGVPVMNAKSEVASSGGFFDELMSLGGTLAKETSLGALQIYKAKELAKVQSKLATQQDAQAQPEVARLNEPVKGVNEKGQTIAVKNTEANTGEKVLFAGITQKQAVIGGGLLIALGITAYMVKG